MVAIDDSDENTFSREFLQSTKRLGIRTISAANIGAVFYAFAVAFDASFFKAAAILLIVTYLAMFGDLRKYLAPVAVLLFLFLLSRWLGIDVAGVFAKLK